MTTALQPETICAGPYRTHPVDSRKFQEFSVGSEKRTKFWLLGLALQRAENTKILRMSRLSFN